MDGMSYEELQLELERLKQTKEFYSMFRIPLYDYLISNGYDLDEFLYAAENLDRFRAKYELIKAHPEQYSSLEYELAENYYMACLEIWEKCTVTYNELYPGTDFDYEIANIKEKYTNKE